MWVLSICKKGSIALMQDYKKELINKLLEIDEPIGSGDLHKYLIETMNGDHPSRASVIFFMNHLVDNKYASFKDATGKGGHHRKYYTKLRKEDFIEKIRQDINTTLDKALHIVFN